MLNFLVLKNFPIFEQLKLEEALLRADQGNWCIINCGSTPAIVMGISADPQAVINLELLQKNPIPVIRRFSGGGTVFVEEGTLFVSLILNQSLLGINPYPREILEWTGALYRPVFGSLPFGINENDYVLGDKKCGGNAQYLTKGRFVHHTSFLWDYTPHHMEYLLMPPKMPAYREKRKHSDFLCTLKPHFEKDEFIERFIKNLALHYTLFPCTVDGALTVLNRPHRSSTELLSRI